MVKVTMSSTTVSFERVLLVKVYMPNMKSLSVTVQKL